MKKVQRTKEILIDSLNALNEKKLEEDYPVLVFEEKPPPAISSYTSLCISVIIWGRSTITGG